MARGVIFRPRLESLEERVQLGDTILGLSALVLGGRGTISWDALLALDPDEHDPVSKNSVSSSILTEN